ncbi:hypothetical protein X805_27260 [Sphaerotilus natans subsp. natans DSM 6575]|uniref:Uncharacterized protein n=1 Tax=Sphaerotilus natans subsp. natans DSM 6575 TaxID=1286631 RepID=A0A059KKF6_9BURK|nr:hypothetical protein X805_27260 [Sphaerotilus natans subsp. natans DSM 6575]
MIRCGRIGMERSVHAGGGKVDEVRVFRDAPRHHMTSR